IAALRANPGKLNGGISGTTNQMQAELLMAATGTKFQIVPYKGVVPITQAILAGELDFTNGLGGHVGTEVDGGHGQDTGTYDERLEAEPSSAQRADTKRKLARRAARAGEARADGQRLVCHVGPGRHFPPSGRHAVRRRARNRSGSGARK